MPATLLAPSYGVGKPCWLVISAARNGPVGPVLSILEMPEHPTSAHAWMTQDVGTPLSSVEPRLNWSQSEADDESVTVPSVMDHDAGITWLYATALKFEGGGDENVNSPPR